MKNLEFKAYVSLSPVDKEEHAVDFNITVDDDKDECSLTIDDVNFAADNAVEVVYPLEFYPKLEVKHTLIMTGGIGYPVLPIEENERTKEELKEITCKFGVDRCLELPYAMYTLSDEYRLYRELMNSGLISDDECEFDYGKMHCILENMKSKKKKTSDSTTRK